MDQNQNQDDILFPMHADADIEGVPGVNIPGLEGGDDSINDAASYDISGGPHPQDFDSDSESDDDEHYPICTQSDRAVNSTQDPDFLYTTIGSDASFLQQIREFEIDHSCDRVKPLTDHEYQSFVRAAEFLEHHEEYRDFLYDYVITSMTM